MYDSFTFVFQPFFAQKPSSLHRVVCSERIGADSTIFIQRPDGSVAAVPLDEQDYVKMRTLISDMEKLITVAVISHCYEQDHISVADLPVQQLPSVDDLDLVSSLFTTTNRSNA